MKPLNFPGGLAPLAKEGLIVYFPFPFHKHLFGSISPSLCPPQDLTQLFLHHLEAPPLSKFNLINLGCQPICEFPSLCFPSSPQSPILKELLMLPLAVPWSWVPDVHLSLLCHLCGCVGTQSMKSSLLEYRCKWYHVHDCKKVVSSNTRTRISPLKLMVAFQCRPS